MTSRMTTTSTATKPSYPASTISAVAASTVAASAVVALHDDVTSHMPPTIDIDVLSRQFLVKGSLNFDTVPYLNLRGRQLIAVNPASIFDLRAVTNSDNAGLALLIAWIKYAKQLNKTVQFCNISEQLLAIAKVCGLYDTIKANLISC